MSFQLQPADAKSQLQQHWCGRSQVSCRCIVSFQLQATELYLGNNHIGVAGAEAIADALRYDNRWVKRLGIWLKTPTSPMRSEKIDRLAEINSESIDCSAVEVGRKKRAEFGPTVDEIYSFIRSKPYLLSA